MKSVAIVQPAPPALQANKRLSFWLPVLVFAILTSAMFGDVLLRGDILLSSENTDLKMQFLPWRDFGFRELAHGQLPLWNPHIYGGTAYFGTFQSAMLYPPNWLHLIMPLGMAINWIIALHVFLAGWFTHLWCRSRGVSVIGSILAGVMFMFSGPYFLHIYAGHLPHLAVMPWLPLMLMAVDGLARDGRVRWTLIGIAALAMQLLAGHPQYVYYIGMAMSVYLLLNLFWTRHRWRLLLGFAAIYLGGVAISAMQVFSGLQAASENVRASGLDFRTAATFGIWPSHLWTLIAPYFLGNDGPLTIENHQLARGLYYAPGYLWELCLFVSLTGLFLALWGMTQMTRAARWVLLPMLGIVFLLSLGIHTPAIALSGSGLIALIVCVLGGAAVWVLLLRKSRPVDGKQARLSRWRPLILGSGAGFGLILLFLYVPFYRLMYDFMPGYNSFRVVAKFFFIVDVLLCMAAGYGLDRFADLSKQRIGTIKLLTFLAGATAVIVGIIALAVWQATDRRSWWGEYQQQLAIEAGANNELFTVASRRIAELNMNLAATRGIPAAQMQIGGKLDGMIAVTATFTSTQLAWAFATLTVLAGLLYLRRYWNYAPYALVCLAAVEMFVFARATRATCNVEQPYPPAWTSALRTDRGDRIMHAYHAPGQDSPPMPSLEWSNWAMARDAKEIWGYDPGVLKRYAETLFYMTKEGPAKASQYLPPITDPSPNIMNMLRWRWLFISPIRQGEAPRVQPAVGDNAASRPLPQALLIDQCIVMTPPKEKQRHSAWRDGLLRGIAAESFNPHQQVVLESEPSIRPRPGGAKGSVSIVNQTSDKLEIKAELTEPAILLVTDNYSTGWKARALEAGPQASYEVMPANYTLRAIPLAAGKHHFVLEYLPTAFVLGCWISAFSLIIYAGAWAWLAWRCRRATN